MSDSLIVAIGVAVVFVGLICIVVLCKFIGLCCGAAKKDVKTAPSAPVVAQNNAPIENRQEIIAAVSAAVAEELGKDIAAIRILSFKKI